MPLDDREQQILAEIEAQFYQEDPDLANAVRNISGRGLGRWTGRMAVAGIIVGIIVLVATFRYNSIIALFGFLLIVISATAVLRDYRRRDGLEEEAVSGSDRWKSWTAKFRNNRRFRPPS
jgi:hypothetical protein